MLAVFVQRARIPAPAFSLMLLQPRHSLLQSRVVGRDSGLPQHEDNKAGAISVAQFRILLTSIATLPVSERGE